MISSRATGRTAESMMPLPRIGSSGSLTVEPHPRDGDALVPKSASEIDSRIRSWAVYVTPCVFIEPENVPWFCCPRAKVSVIARLTVDVMAELRSLTWTERDSSGDVNLRSDMRPLPISRKRAMIRAS